MATTVQVKRRVNGAAGSPGAPGALEGELALNFPGAAGGTTKPVLFAFDGSAWRTVNPDVTVTTQSIDLNTPGGANIGAAFTAWDAVGGNDITGNVVIATYGNPAQAYVLTNAAAAGTSGSWTSLGGAVTFATGADIITGTDTTKAINAAALRAATVVTSAGAADANKLVRLDANGMIDAAMLTIPDVLTFKTSVDTTAAYSAPAGLAKGDVYISANNGPPHATWTAVITGNPTHIQAGELLIYNGTTFDAIQSNIDPSAYVEKTGANTLTNTMVMTFTAAASMTTRIDGGDATKSRIDNFSIDAGTF